LLYILNYFSKKFSGTSKNHAYCKCEYIGLFSWINNPSANFALPASLLWFGDILPPSYDCGCTPTQ